MASVGGSVERRVEFIAGLEDLGAALDHGVVLDLGCGRHALWSRAYAARGARVVGLEVDPERCRDAQGRLAENATPLGGRVLGILRAEGEHLPLASESVGFVHCAQVLEHVRDPRRFLGELRRVLAPGGHCYLTAINRFAFRDPHFQVIGVNYLPGRLADRVLAWLGATNPEGQQLSEMHYFSHRSFRHLCAESGLELVTDLKRRERLRRRGAVAGRLANLWGTVRSSAFHLLIRRPAGA
jgi:SAM-dependent methyltransferase